jgi:hypothetical protein
LYTRASLVSYRSLVKQISGRPVHPDKSITGPPRLSLHCCMIYGGQ